jgi:hypothetical protein
MRIAGNRTYALTENQNVHLPFCVVEDTIFTLFKEKIFSSTHKRHFSEWLKRRNFVEAQL